MYINIYIYYFIFIFFFFGGGGYCPRYFFGIYLDELLKRIERTGIGCHIGHHFDGGLGYADDVVLLSPTVCGLLLLINTSEEFANEHNVTFNSRKTVCSYFWSRHIIACTQLSLNSVKIPWQTSAKHLGNYLNYDLNDEIDFFILVFYCSRKSIEFRLFHSTKWGKIKFTTDILCSLLSLPNLFAWHHTRW